MKTRNFTQFVLFGICALIFFACSKNEPNAIQPPTPIPGGGMVSGTYENTEEGITDSFLINDVSARATTLGGFSFVTSNDAYEILFFFPDVSDTGQFLAPYTSNSHFRVIENGDTIPCSTNDFILHITHFEVFSNHTLISGTYKLFGVKGGYNDPYITIKDGEFLDIPIIHNGSSGNYLIYQGEEEIITRSEVMVVDNFFFSRYKFDNKSVSTMQYDKTNSSRASSGMNPYDAVHTQINISQIVESEQTVSGWIKTTENYDLELHFQDVDYISFPELQDGQMVMLFNFGEVITYFDSAKFVLDGFSSGMYTVYGYYGSNEIKLSAPYDTEEANPIHGQTFLYNTGFTFIEGLINGYSHRSFSSNNTKMSFEFGRVMGLGLGSEGYNQLYIEGKNIPIGL